MLKKLLEFFNFWNVKFFPVKYEIDKVFFSYSGFYIFMIFLATSGVVFLNTSIFGLHPIVVFFIIACLTYCLLYFLVCTIAMFVFKTKPIIRRK